MEIRALTQGDVPAAMRLSTQAGWNQVADDWRRLLELAPEGCFAGWVDGELVATSTAIDYGGRVAWIGMVLVEESHRRRGYGSRIFDRALAHAQDAAPVVGLDATDAGRSVYERDGFVPVCDIERWRGTPEPGGGSAAATVESVEAADADAIVALDRDACGVDRGPFLRSLLASPEVTGLAIRRDSDVRGYGVLRPGRTAHHLGPVVAESAESVGALLDAVAERLDGDALIVDPLDGAHADALSDAGLERRRRLTRMVHEDPVAALCGERVVAAAGFEWG